MNLCTRSPIKSLVTQERRRDIFMVMGSWVAGLPEISPGSSWMSLGELHHFFRTWASRLGG